MQVIACAVVAVLTIVLLFVIARNAKDTSSYPSAPAVTSPSAGTTSAAR